VQHKETQGGADSAAQGNTRRCRQCSTRKHKAVQTMQHKETQGQHKHYVQPLQGNFVCSHMLREIGSTVTPKL